MKTKQEIQDKANEAAAELIELVDHSTPQIAAAAARLAALLEVLGVVED